MQNSSRDELFFKKQQYIIVFILVFANYGYFKISKYFFIIFLNI